MRKYKKQQLLELIQTLFEAHNIIKKEIDSNNNTYVVQLLTDCQSAAIQIGTTIEESEGKGLDVVKILEDYCNYIYEISLDIKKENTFSYLKRLNALIEKIRKGVDEIRVKYEIVFLPYKASMWDSLESIWNAAKNDLGCECYVVPIPYIDKGVKGSANNIIYEGEEFPKHVDITNFKEYSIEQRQPDIIYIHNPYDNANYATSVYPEYYASNLKNHTNKLVYIPYFVTDIDIPLHFCTLPGVLHADLVIVQSEEIRDIYIREYNNVIEEYGLASIMIKADKKFIALGSPKIDATLYYENYEHKLPSKWDSQIGQRKVILYNTHFKHLLENARETFDKMKNVFSYFKNNKDFILWWRPHPLTVSVISSMEPKLLKEFNDLKEEYLTKSIGIFDDTSDVHRAIAISDFYYGDASSIVYMYGITGKPMMYQNIYINTGTKIECVKLLSFSDYVLEGDNIWFSANNYNGLYKGNINTGMAERVCLFDGEDKTQKSLYSTVERYGDKLLFTPFTAKEIAVFNMKDYTIKKISLPKAKYKAKYNTKFYNTVKYKKNIFILACSYPMIIKFNMENEEITYFDDWVNDDIDGGVIFRKTTAVIGNLIYIAFCQGNKVFEFDMDKCDGRFITIGNDKNIYNGICFDGNDFWLAPRNNNGIIKWNKETGEIETINDERLNYKYGAAEIFYFEESIWINYSKGTGLLCLDPKNKKIVEINKDIYDLKVNNNWYEYFFSKEIKDRVLLLNTRNYGLYQLKDKKMKIITYMKDYRHPEEIIKEIHQFETEEIGNENHVNLLSYIKKETFYQDIKEVTNLPQEDNDKNNHKKAFENLFTNPDGSSGNRIHEYVLKQLKHKERNKE